MSQTPYPKEQAAKMSFTYPQGESFSVLLLPMHSDLLKILLFDKLALVELYKGISFMFVYSRHGPNMRVNNFTKGFAFSTVGGVLLLPILDLAGQWALEDAHDSEIGGSNTLHIKHVIHSTACPYAYAEGLMLRYAVWQKEGLSQETVAAFGRCAVPSEPRPAVNSDIDTLNDLFRRNVCPEAINAGNDLRYILYFDDSRFDSTTLSTIAAANDTTPALAQGNYTTCNSLEAE